jgi:outer membrane biosynthesis protein TonB
MNPDPAVPDSSIATADLDGETILDRVSQLVQGFVDGVLTVTGIKASTVETQQLCIGDTCVTESQLIELLENSNQSPTPTPEPEPTPDPEPEQDPTPEPEQTPEPEPDLTPEPEPEPDV